MQDSGSHLLMHNHTDGNKCSKDTVEESMDEEAARQKKTCLHYKNGQISVYITHIWSCKQTINV